MPDSFVAPYAMAATKIHTIGGAATLSTKEPKNHLMPSLPNNDLTCDSGKAALMSHDTRKSSTCIAGMTSTTQLRMFLRFLILIFFQTLYTEWHTTQIGNLFFGVTKCEMA